MVDLLINILYHTRSQTLNFDSARQSSLEALRSERGAPPYWEE